MISMGTTPISSQTHIKNIGTRGKQMLPFWWWGRVIFFVLLFFFFFFLTGRGSSIGSESAWHASGPEFDPHVRHILSWRLGHENISTAILSLPLIQEEQLSVTGERICTKYW